MVSSSVLMLYNQPVLPRDHPDAESEHSVVEVATDLGNILVEAGYAVSHLGLGVEPDRLWLELQSRKSDVVFNLFEGNLDNTETEAYVAGLLEWSGIPFTGSPHATLTLARAKHTVKHLLRGAGLPTADFFTLDALPLPETDLIYPVIVKPAQQDGSVGIDQKSVCANRAELESRVQYVLTTYGAPVLVERYISGREVNIAVVELPDLLTLRPTEIFLPAEKSGTWSILTYEGKWSPESPAYLAPDPNAASALPELPVAELNRLAKLAYRLLGCRDYARVDFRIDPAGQPYILEVNPNPEISEHVSFTKSLDSVSLTYKQFVVGLVRQAESRKAACKPSFTPDRYLPPSR
jgi:D-alanine-D-alanine ligase